MRRLDELPSDWRAVNTLRQLRVGKNRSVPRVRRLPRDDVRADVLGGSFGGGGGGGGGGHAGRWGSPPTRIDRRLAALPEALFSDLSAMELFDCGDNQLRMLPPFAPRAVLKTLLAPRNRLQGLDPLVVAVASLETLDVGGNVVIPLQA